MFAGGLQLPAAETERTAGSSHCLWGKLIPEKMHTPTYWPKMRRVTSIKFSVSCLKDPHITLTTILTLVMRLFSFKLLFQSIMSSQSAWMHTTNSGECFVIWCCEPLVQRKLYHSGRGIKNWTLRVKIIQSIPVRWCMGWYDFCPPQTRRAHT